MLDTIRKILAGAMLIGVPPALAYWLVLHPWASFWRRRRPAWAIGTASASMLIVATPLAILAPAWLAHDLGSQPLLWVLATPLMIASAWLDVRCRRQLSLGILAGVAEVTEAEDRPRLLTQGAFARIRHPRYAAALLGLTATALFANHIASWIVWGLSLPGLWLIIALEEHELVQRFGAEYERYRERVPALIPRRR